MYIPNRAKTSLRWWTSPENLRRGVHWLQNPAIHITTDASACGWGAHVGNQFFQGPWPQRIKEQSSNFRELQAVWQVLQQLGNSLQNQHIKILSDNVTAVAHIRHQGGTRSPPTAKHRTENLSLGGGPDPLDHGNPLKGDTKRKSRLPQQEADRPRRVVPLPRGIQNLNQPVGDPTVGPLRNQGEHKSRQLFLPPARRSSDSGRRPRPGLGTRTGLRLSSHTTNPQGFTALQNPGMHANPSDPLLAEKKLVRSSDNTERPGPSHLPYLDGSSIAGATEPPQPRQTPFNGMALEESSLRKKGFSEKVVETLMSSRKKTTHLIYQKVWRKFSSWRQGRDRGDSIPDTPLILEFLQEGLEMGLSPSTLKVQVSALSAICDTKFADDRWVHRFLTAAARLRPRPINRFPDWNLNWVLGAMTAVPFEPIEALPIRMLTIKTIFLVAITSARRVSELQALSIRHPLMKIADTKLIFKTDPAFMPKVVSDFHRSQDIIIPSFFSNPKNEEERTLSCLDVRRAVLTYIDTTSHWRRDDNLFVQFSGPNKGSKAAKRSIARWIRLAIIESYKALGKEIPLALKAHSTRAVASSWAEHSSASVEQICKAAVWKKPHTFTKHYRVKVQQDEDMAFGRKVL
ncbi:uncharacterized protein [Eleutherodactylus coqui]|uniref:uncharacterized protein n=1 Tax=Eleutherodactylus coqui TaxID=57060 RepID=UPI0034632726